MARYSVGLDLGDGESAIAWVDNSGETDPWIFQRTSGEVGVLTAIADGAQHNKFFGEAAVLQPEAKYVKISFKERPARTSAGIVPTIAAVEFAKLFVIEFLQARKEVAEDCLIYVGYPAGWNPNVEVDIYRQQLADALRPYGLAMVAESQSAFIDVHDAAGTDASLRPALVIDVGSSTTDFTLVSDRVKNLPFGSELGCRMIDRSLAADLARRLAVRDRKRLERPGTARNLLLWMCRRYKESRSQGVPVDRPADLRGELAWVFDVCWDHLLTIDVEDVVDKCWRPRFREELYKVLGWLNGVPPALALTTGGGSRMKLVEEECRSVFGQEAVKPVANPSLAVARGLASYGRWTHRVEKFHQEIRALPERIELAKIVTSKSRSLARQFYQSFFLVGWNGVVRNAIQNEQLAGEVWTYPRLMEWYSEWLQSTEGRQERKKIIGPLEDEVTGRLSPKIESLCSSYGLPADAISTRVHLPAGVIIRPMGRLMIAFDIVASAHGILSQFQARTQFGRSYLLNVAPALARAVAPAGSIVASGYYFTAADLESLTAGIRMEIEEQLEERVRGIEALLV